MSNLVTIQKASSWASKYLNSEIDPSNISYLVQYGRVKSKEENGKTLVDRRDLKKYYQNNWKTREKSWKKELGDDLNWHLSFEDVREKDRTKHVHRLHQYKGKFIPQLVEYFLDSHTDDFKTDEFFKKGDIVLDPFVGSGTTLVQADELGLHGIGIDVSEFNCLISKAKIINYDIKKLEKAVSFLIQKLESSSDKIVSFYEEIYNKMNNFNDKHFPNKDYRYKVNKGKINENKYSKEKESEFIKVYDKLLEKYNINPYTKSSDNFPDKWYMDNIREEMEFLKSLIKKGKDKKTVDLLKVILSRTIRSCRATTHSNLARLQDPQTTPYYCRKHKKICIPLYTLKDKFKRYAKDTLRRVKEFNEIRSGLEHFVVVGDSRSVDIHKEIKKDNLKFHKKIKKNGIKGIFTSPPYVGQIDYHEQHAYSYELFNFKRRDNKEIGPLFRGKGREARESYVEGISGVLKNCKKYLADNFDIFLVANDKHNLYPKIAEKSGMKIVNKFKRPVLNRTSRDRNPYSEIIFHLKNNK